MREKEGQDLWPQRAVRIYLSRDEGREKTGQESACGGIDGRTRPLSMMG